MSPHPTLARRLRHSGVEASRRSMIERLSREWRILADGACVLQIGKGERGYEARVVHCAGDLPLPWTWALVKGRIDEIEALQVDHALATGDHDNEDDAKISAADALALFFLRDEWGEDLTRLEMVGVRRPLRHDAHAVIAE